jgi:hypothetical protein
MQISSVAISLFVAAWRSMWRCQISANAVVNHEKDAGSGTSRQIRRAFGPPSARRGQARATAGGKAPSREIRISQDFR